MDHPIRVDRTININTLISIAGFLCVILGGAGTIGFIYSNMQSQNKSWTDFQTHQESYNAKLDADRQSERGIYDTKLDTLFQALQKLTTVSDRQSDQVASLQKKDDENDARLSRMAESYGNKFTEMQATLSTITTQLALQNQSITEIKQVLVGTPMKRP